MTEPIPVKTISSALKGTSVPGAPGNETAWLDKLNNVLSTVDSILGKSDKLGGVVQGLIKRKESITSSPDNPVREQKITERESGKARQIVQEARDMPEPKIVYKEARKEDIMKRVNKNFYVEIVPDLIDALDEKIPDDFKKKTIAEIFAMYRESGDFMKGQINQLFGKEVYQIVEASIDAKTQSESSEGHGN